MPFLAIDAALFAQQQHWGLIPSITNLYPSLSATFTITICIILLDAAIYLQHRLFHQIPLLWRLHRMHHSDLDIDVSAAIRFHPIEIILSMWIKIAVVIALGAPVVAVILFELLLNLTAMFSHSNIKLSVKFDRYLRYLFVTPDMHRVHHSINSSETNRNFGFCLPWWDRIFASYQDQPKMGHLNMQIGLPYFRQQQECQIQRMLTQPFRQEIK
jgi:sterol desaturase/sphingolipid hydroxylase (fatty acid hydroxylase superfamily)